MKFLQQSVNGKDKAEDRRERWQVMGQVFSESVTAETWEGVDRLASESKKKSQDVSQGVEGAASSSKCCRVPFPKFKCYFPNQILSMVTFSGLKSEPGGDLRTEMTN